MCKLNILILLALLCCSCAYRDTYSNYANSMADVAAAQATAEAAKYQYLIAVEQAKNTLKLKALDVVKKGTGNVIFITSGQDFSQSTVSKLPTLSPPESEAKYVGKVFETAIKTAGIGIIAHEISDLVETVAKTGGDHIEDSYNSSSDDDISINRTNTIKETTDIAITDDHSTSDSYNKDLDYTSTTDIDETTTTTTEETNIDFDIDDSFNPDSSRTDYLIP